MAGHLYRRTAGGAGWRELEHALRDGPRAAIDRILRPANDATGFNRTSDAYEDALPDSESADALRAWWLRRMLQTPHPLLETMTFFWHDFFGVSNARVKSAAFMRQHVRLLRAHALGQYDQLLKALTRDPGMLASVECRANRRSQPNPAFARALLEHFTVGGDAYQENDVRELARALTGAFVQRQQFRYYEREHDTGEKILFGRRGPFDGDGAIDLLLEQRSTARRVVRALYRRFIAETEEPGEAILGPLIDSFRANRDIAAIVERMLRSNLFFSPVAYRKRLKSPIEFGLGIVRGLGGIISTVNLAEDTAALGQNLYHPPTVKGWPGGRTWLSWLTVLRRRELAHALLGGTKRYGEKLDPLATAASHGFVEPAAAGQFLIDLFLQSDLDADARNAVLRAVSQTAAAPRERVRRGAQTLVMLPEFQVA
jgi:uncharacterized protein (DUF1800 family)